MVDNVGFPGEAIDDRSVGRFGVGVGILLGRGWFSFESCLRGGDATRKASGR